MALPVVMDTGDNCREESQKLSISFGQIIMKTLTIIVALIFSLAVQAQTGTPVFRIGDNGLIETDPSMIESFYDMPQIKTRSYVLNNPVNVSVGMQNYDVKTGCLEQWDDFGGSFNVITIYSGIRKIFELRQPDNWIYTYGIPGRKSYQQYTDNQYFIPIVLSDQAVALAFIGWPYGGEMPYLTIIALTNNDAKLVFNKHMGINAITQSGSSYTMELQANIVEYGDDGQPFDEPNNVPDIHYLEAKNGLLYLNKKISEL